MPCYCPITAWRSKSVNPVSNKRSLVFSPVHALQAEAPEKIPCGQCIGCRLERSRQWAMRCMHEAQMHDDNCFITLTFSPEALMLRKNPFSLDVKDFQLFMKRLRKRFGAGIRFYHCGEYGEKNGRPHYHACIFGFDFPDKELWKVTNTGHRLYVSEALQELWPFGFSTIGNVTFESAAYVARYIMKKVNGDAAEARYTIFDDDTGEVIDLKPEYTTMSRRPGIGGTWLKKYFSDVYPRDYVIVDGKKMRPPRYYDVLCSRERPYEFDEIKERRLINANEHLDNCTTDRLLIREKVQEARLKLLVRNEV